MFYTKEQIVETMREWLLVLRSSVSVTQADLCAAIGISRQTYSAIVIEKNVLDSIFSIVYVFYCEYLLQNSGLEKRKLCSFSVPLSWCRD